MDAFKLRPEKTRQIIVELDRVLVNQVDKERRRLRITRKRFIVYALTELLKRIENEEPYREKNETE